MEQNVTSYVSEFFHVGLEKPFEALGVFVQIFDFFSQVEIFSGQPLNLVLKTSLSVVCWGLVDRLKTT